MSEEKTTVVVTKYRKVPEVFFQSLLEFMRDQPYRKVAGSMHLFKECELIEEEVETEKDG